MKAVLDAQERLQEEQLRKVRDHLTEINSQLFDKASAYSNLIIFAGYAGTFAVWANTKEQLPDYANISVALLVSASLFIFVVFTVFQMVSSTRHFLQTRKLLLTASSAEQLLERAKARERAQEQHILWLMPFWALSVIGSVVTALAAALLLFYNFIAVLLGWPGWPS